MSAATRLETDPRAGAEISAVADDHNEGAQSGAIHASAMPQWFLTACTHISAT